MSGTTSKTHSRAASMTKPPSLSIDETIQTDPVEIPSGPMSLARAVYCRRPEYIRPHRIRVKVGTWNVARNVPTAYDLRKWFFQPAVDGLLEYPPMPPHRVPTFGSTKSSSVFQEVTDGPRLPCKNRIGLYVLGLQEAQPGSFTNNVDPVIEDHWSDSIADALPPGYVRIAREVIGGIIMLIYAAAELAPSISNVSTYQVGTGLMGFYSNKGGVSVRLVLGETTRIVFTNSHLASGCEPQFLERRCWDASTIKSRTSFTPVRLPGGPETGTESMGDEDVAFWLGDLNFRLDAPGEDIRGLFALHTDGMYGVPQEPSTPISLASSSSIMEPTEIYDSDTDTVLSPRSAKFPYTFEDAAETLPGPEDFVPEADEDPLSLQTTLNSLLPHDQLAKVIRKKKAFHDGWREGPITFMPTYKYDIGSRDNFDSSEKQRAPSWCDRVLYRSRNDLQRYLHTVQEQREASEQEEQFENHVAASTANSENTTLDGPSDNPDLASTPIQTTPVWDYDEYDENEDDNDAASSSPSEKEELDRVRLEQYWSVQSITSSDHKPVMALFTIDYDAVVPDLRAIVQAEVAREFDRAENEGRPDVTIVVDNQSIEPTAIDTSQGETVNFGPVSIMKRAVQSMTIANTGQVAAKFSFVERPDSDDRKVWLSASFVALDPDDDGELPDLGDVVTLQPGGTVGIQLDALVDDIVLARELNAGAATLDDVLVLRVEDGRDHFVPVHGEWLPTCIGRALNELIRVPDGGIREFMKKEKLHGSIPHNYEVRCSAPKELFKLVESLLTFTERASADESMLEGAEIPREKPGWPFEKATWLISDGSVRHGLVAAVLESLDLDKPIAEAFPLELPALSRVEIVAEVLLLLLHSMTDGIITVSLWETLEERMPNLGNITTSPCPPSRVEDTKTALLDILAHDPGHSISLVFLTSTLGRVCAELSPVSKADLEAAKVTSPVSALGFAARWRRSVSVAGASGGDVSKVLKRRQREKKIAECFAEAVCRVSAVGVGPREKRDIISKQAGLIGLFIQKGDE